MNLEEVIKTKNLILEPIYPSHAEKLFSLLQAPELYGFIPHEPPKDVIKLKEKYQRWAKRKSDDGQEIWLNYALYRPVISEYVGTIQATIQSENTYIAYEVFPHFWRQGIAREACLALLEILFKDYGINIVTAHADTRNIASLKLLKSLGFEKIKLISGADEFKGSISDEYIYKLIK